MRDQISIAVRNDGLFSCVKLSLEDFRLHRCNKLCRYNRLSKLTTSHTRARMGDDADDDDSFDDIEDDIFVDDVDDEALGQVRPDFAFVPTRELY